ncbi:MAG TPA: hypothetical protein VLI90_14090 [Tepidisphaeraceae bacterium]|nr:hypothetical protein [Tepidisphaeraceae bacterium]
MKLTRSQKVSFAFLAVAVGGFVVDRIFFTPATADAAPPGRSAVAEVVAAGINKIETAVASDVSASVEGLISAKLKTVPGVNVEQVRDVFAPASKWVDAHKPPPAVIARQERSNGVAEFVAGHKLSAVMAGRGGVGGDALVDGQVVHVGQKVGDWRLVSLTSRSAVFTCNGARATLLLP